MVAVRNFVYETVDTTIIMRNGTCVLLFAIGTEAKKAQRLLPQCNGKLDGSSINVRDFLNKQSASKANDVPGDVNVAIVLFSDGHAKSFERAEDIGQKMKAAGICCIGIAAINRSVDDDEAKAPIDDTSYMTPAELILEPLISCFDCFIFASIGKGDEATAERNALTGAATLLLDFLLCESESERNRNIEKIRESGIAYYDSVAFTDEWDVQAAASQLVFRLLFASPIYAAGTVFVSIRHGSSFYLSSGKENDGDDEYIFSYLEDHLDADAYYCTKCSEDQALQPYDFVVSVLACRFNGQSTLFDEHGVKQYPEIFDRRLRKRIDRALNYPFSIVARLEAYESYRKEKTICAYCSGIENNH